MTHAAGLAQEWVFLLPNGSLDAYEDLANN